MLSKPKDGLFRSNKQMVQQMTKIAELSAINALMSAIQFDGDQRAMCRTAQTLNYCEESP